MSVIQAFTLTPTRITNFVIVEITPIGIESLGWRFWIIWTVFNAVFLPVIYFLYPETANRSLEDLDAYYRENPSLIVVKDKDAISTKRPQKYTYHEREAVQEIVKRNSSVVGTMREKTNDVQLIENNEG